MNNTAQGTTETAVVTKNEDPSDSSGRNGASVDEGDEGNTMEIVIIKFGKYLNRMARITSIGANNRYNLQIMYDNGVLSRRNDGAIENTALVRSKFEVLSDNLEVAMKLLPKRRLELNLSDAPPPAPPARRHTAGPASAQIGSPMNRSKTKPRSAGDDSGGAEDDDDGESRCVDKLLSWNLSILKVVLIILAVTL
jgi:hypothetical protein